MNERRENDQAGNVGKAIHFGWDIIRMVFDPTQDPAMVQWRLQRRLRKQETEREKLYKEAVEAMIADRTEKGKQKYG